MAAKQKLEVVPSLPVRPTQDLEELLAPHLAEELISKVDMGKLSRLAISHMGRHFQQKFIDWLVSDNSPQIALTEVDAIAASVEDVAA